MEEYWILNRIEEMIERDGEVEIEGEEYIIDNVEWI